jgi:hypothetical protein
MHFTIFAKMPTFVFAKFFTCSENFNYYCSVQNKCEKLDPNAPMPPTIPPDHTYNFLGMSNPNLLGMSIQNHLGMSKPKCCVWSGKRK